MASGPSVELPVSLVARYVDHLTSLSVEMERLNGELSMDAAPDAFLEEMRAMAHRLAGTAASYGFPELSDAASALEQTIRAGARHTDQALSLRLVCFCDQLSRAAKCRPVQAA